MRTVKNFHKFEEEKLSILDKLFKNIPKFEEKYKKGIRLFRAGVASVKAAEPYAAQGKTAGTKGYTTLYAYMCKVFRFIFNDIHAVVS